MTSIDSVTLQVNDLGAAQRFYDKAFGLGDTIKLAQSDAPTDGFRGFTLSLVAAQPSTARGFFDSAVAAGGTPIKPFAKSFWGVGGTVVAPDGTIWKFASSAKKDTGPATREVDQIVLLLGTANVAASKAFYTDQGIPVAKSFMNKYVQFDLPDSPIQLALYGHKALAKDAGVPADGDGSHRLVVNGSRAPITDPDGFEWAPAA
ncbi:glyoxalase [Jongsikchunia kroppenstedtii]|uniref:glyoxalase n=1 Tax=Jongsikchunia kroppenstedtii TaxID=1121721 RepID=UPI0004758F49|nr:glyoxalase [Jongsikchunia kroppenstedtii]